MKTFQVWRRAREGDESVYASCGNTNGISQVEVQADSIDFASTGALLFYTNGQPARSFNKNEWVEVVTEENRIHNLV